MADFALFEVDLDTPRPNPTNNTQVLRGDSPRVAFTKHNDLLDVLHQVVNHTGPLAPSPSFAFMSWLDTGTEPPTVRRRNAENTAWVAVEYPLPKAKTADPVLTEAREMSFRLVDDTTLKVFVRGADGVTRSSTLVLS